MLACSYEPMQPMCARIEILKSREIEPNAIHKHTYQTRAGHQATVLLLSRTTTIATAKCCCIDYERAQKRERDEREETGEPK